MTHFPSFAALKQLCSMNHLGQCARDWVTGREKKWWEKENVQEQRVHLSPVNLHLGVSFVIRWRYEEKSNATADKRPALWVIFPFCSISSWLHLKPTEAASLLEQAHLMQPTKECDCAPMPVLSPHCYQPLCCFGSVTPHLKVQCHLRGLHQETPDQVISLDGQMK